MKIEDDEIAVYAKEDAEMTWALWERSNDAIVRDFTTRAEALVDWESGTLGLDVRESLLDLFAEMTYTVGDDDAAFDPERVEILPGKRRALRVTSGGETYVWNMDYQDYCCESDYGDDSDDEDYVYLLVFGVDHEGERVKGVFRRPEGAREAALEEIRGSRDVWAMIAPNTWRRSDLYLEIRKEVLR